jgi:hypothetical protein
LAASTGSQWRYIGAGQLVEQLRFRLRDPGVITQNPTHLCGPIAVVVELARRNPEEYVRAVTELLERGAFTTVGGASISAEAELREEPVPTGAIEEADWILAASMRDDANVHEDVDDEATGLESLTLWGAMAYWTRNVLGLSSSWETTMTSGELPALRKCPEALAAGGVAFLLVDADLLKTGVRETEEEIWWQRANHLPGLPVQPFGPLTHAKDDDWPPNHWVVFLGDLALGGEDGPISLRVWSWGAEFVITGTADSFTEYQYAVVTGVPPT